MTYTQKCHHLTTLNAIKYLTETWRHQVNYKKKNSKKKGGFFMDSKHRYLQGEAGSAHLTLLAVPEGAGGMCLAGKAGFAVGPSAVGEGHKGH